MRSHTSIALDHTSFTAISARANASRSRIHACIDGRNDDLDLFQIDRILTHEVEGVTRVYLLDRRAERVKLPAFDATLPEPHRSTLCIFWARKDSWGPQELVPAASVAGDAAIVSTTDLLGYSAGEDQRQSGLHAA
ncbi:hypothetical protein V8E36_000427 [Tilletia maclaganii]